MKNWLLLLAFAAFIGPLSADIPQLQLDGTYSKESPYKNDYPYSIQDVEGMRKNPHGAGIKAKIPEDSPEFSSLTSKFEGLDYKIRDEDLRAKHVHVEEKEIELTEKEREVANAYPQEFPVESSRGVRVQTSAVLKLADKEYNCNGGFFLGEGDWNGDKVNEVFIQFNDGATHAGARTTIKVFSENGDYVWSTTLMTLRMGWTGVLDYDNDGLVELVLNSGEPRSYQVIGCPAAGEKLEPYQNESSEDLVNEVQQRENISQPKGPAPKPSNGIFKENGLHDAP